MPLPFHPNPGLIVICDFEGLKEPEITKRRPAIVMSPRRRDRGRLCTVLPISTTAPDRETLNQFQLHIAPALPEPYPEQDVWVKCDLIYTVSLERLNLPWWKDDEGKRQYVQQVVGEDDMQAIQRCMLAALGFQELARFL